MNSYRSRLFRIASELTESEVSDLKFACKEHVPAGLLERVCRPLELFDQLEKLNLLGPDDGGFLGDLLAGINRRELQDELFGREGGNARDSTLVLIQETLKDHYKNEIGWLQPLTWNESFRLHIKQIYTNLELITTKQHSSSPSRKPLNSYEELFVTSSRQNKTKRILIEGKAGVGKSTLVSEMAYDWATNENLAQFSMVFFIELKHVLGRISDAMFDLLPKDFPITCEQLYKYVQGHQEQVLFILDGYDEIKPSRVGDVHDLISGKILRQSTVILTSRPSKASKIHWFMDFRVEVKGFTSENMRQFIYRYFQENPESAKSLISDLDMHPVAEDIARIPLTALLICAMWGEMPHALVLSTMTSLFVELTICLVKRHYARMDKQAECDPEELASLQDIPRDLYDALLQLGEIAFEGLIEDQLIFDQKALEKNCSHKGIFELGFLSLEKSSSRLKPVQKCRFVHRCYQEFLAAFWLSSKIKEALTDSSVYEEVLVHGMRCVTMNKTTVLFSFTPGLLGDAFKEFLDLVIKEGSVIADSEELKQKLFIFCLQALFESQQGHLAGNLAEYAPDGVIRITEEVELSPYDIRAMAFFVHHYPGAKTLIFEDTYLSKRHLATLGRCLSEMKNLKELHFVRSFAASDAMEVFVSNLSRDLSLERLVSLRSKLLGKDFAQVIKCCPRLKSLDMVNNELGQSMEQVLIALKSCQQLQSVRFKQEIILPRFCTHLCSFVRHSRTLTNVTIENSSISSLDDLFSLLDSLLALSSKLRYLCLSDLLVLKKHIGAHQSVYSTLDNVVPSLKLLEHIDLSRNNLSNWTRMTSTFDGLKSIKHINLSANKMCDAGVGLLAKALVNLSNLEVLHLAWNEITCEGAILLADSLSGLTRLEALSLKSNKIANKGAIALFRALSGVPAIQRIFLAGNLITSAGVCGMVEHLQGMHNLRCLNLKHNLIDESGFLAVTHVIRHLPQLHQLLLGSPVIPKDQMDSGGIAQACASHYTHIFTQMSSAGFTLLMEDANSHPTLESISISMNAIPKGVDAEGLPKLKFWGHYDDQ